MIELILHFIYVQLINKENKKKKIYPWNLFEF